MALVSAVVKYAQSNAYGAFEDSKEGIYLFMFQININVSLLDK